MIRAFLMAQWLAYAGPVPTTHDVERGESLWSIARSHGCTIDDLREANPRLVEPLQAGARLVLPKTAAAAKPARPAASMKPERAAKPKAEPPRAASAKPGPGRASSAKAPPKATDEGAKPAEAKSPREHVVARGDTLEAIAKRYDTSVTEIQELNRMRTTKIVVGQRLHLRALGDASDDPDERGTLPKPPGRFDLPPPPDDPAPRLADADDDDDPPPRASTATAAPLVGAVQLPRDKAYYLRHPKRAWGLPHVVESTRAAVVAVKRRHPGVHRLAIGDISAERGGRLSGHKSHRSGRDVDIGLYFRRAPASYPQKFVGAKAAPLDLAATWALIEAFYEQSKRPGGPVQIFLDFEVQGDIYEWARKHGVSRRVLREVFQYPHGRWARRGLVRHEPAHDDHLHVRYGDAPPSSRRSKG